MHRQSKLKCLIALSLILSAVASGPAIAQKLVSGAPALKHAVAMAARGETIVIAAGRYEIGDLKIPRDLNLTGRGKVIFFSSKPVAKGLLNPLPGASIRIENIAFSGAVSPDENGAGIRHDGDNLTIVNCIFEGNENGILATGSKDARIRIRGSSFLRNGFGDGYSHGIYVVRAAALEISDSKFSGTKIGHHVKSLAARTRLTNSIFDDADGRTSYAVDASKGGDVLIADNVIIQAADADNSTIINYDLSRGGKSVSLAILNNRITNRHRNGQLLRNDTELAPVMSGNEITNEGRGRLTLD